MAISKSMVTTFSKWKRLVMLPWRFIVCTIQYYKELGMISKLSAEAKNALSLGTTRVTSTSSYAEMVYVLSLDPKRINLWLFDLISPKSKLNMFQEIQQRDMTLRFNRVIHRVQRHAFSVQIIINNHKKNLRWLEAARKYPSGRMVRKLQEFTLKETLKEEEKAKAKQACIRALREELPELWKKMTRGTVDNGMLTPLGYSESLIDPPETHESSVYRGVLSVVITQKFELHTDEFLSEYEPTDGEIVIVKDDGGAEDAKDNWVEIHFICISTV